MTAGDKDLPFIIFIPSFSIYYRRFNCCYLIYFHDNLLLLLLLFLILKCFCNAVTLFYGHANKTHCCCCCLFTLFLFTIHSTILCAPCGATSASRGAKFVLHVIMTREATLSPNILNAVRKFTRSSLYISQLPRNQTNVERRNVFLQIAFTT